MLDYQRELLVNLFTIRSDEKQERLHVIWLNALDCTKCSESFFRSDNPKITYLLQHVISLQYTNALSFRDREEFMEHDGEFVLILEGTLTGKNEQFNLGRQTLKEKIQELAKCAKVVIAIGNCACCGKAEKNGESLCELLPPIPIIPILGCPVQSDILADTLLAIWKKEA